MLLCANTTVCLSLVNFQFLVILFSILFIHLAILKCSFSIQILFQNLVYGCCFTLSSYLFVEIYFVMLKYPIWSVLLEPVWLSFECPFLRQHLLICLFILYCKTCLLFTFDRFLQTYLRSFPILRNFVCYRSLFTYPSSLISQPRLLFLFGFLWGTPFL